MTTKIILKTLLLVIFLFFIYMYSSHFKTRFNVSEFSYSPKLNVTQSSYSPKPAPHWQLVWSEEFNQSRINEKVWTLQVGGGGWGNNELQYYTDTEENCYIDHGNLIMKGIKKNYKGHRFTSARIMTRGKMNFLYGKIDIRAKLPKGKGLLPAFWLLPSEETYEDRRKNGEIDIMEMLGEKPKVIYGVAHYAKNSGSRSFGKYSKMFVDFSEGFHVYSIKWTQEAIEWLVDDETYFVLNLNQKFNASYNPFRKNFYLIMNLAIGGNWPGNDIDVTDFPTKMEVDYVRYYVSESRSSYP